MKILKLNVELTASELEWNCETFKINGQEEFHAWAITRQGKLFLFWIYLFQNGRFFNKYLFCTELGFNYYRHLRVFYVEAS